MKILFYCGINNLVNFHRIRPFYDLCYGFDANPDKIEQAKKFYANDPDVKIIYGALTEKGGEEVEFTITTDWDPSSSLGTPNPEHIPIISKPNILAAQKKIKVPTINLHDFCVSNNIDKIDALITDLQGIDFTVVKTLAKFIQAGKIHEIQCEVEPDDKPTRYLGIPPGKLKDFNKLLSDNYDVLWMDPPEPPPDAWEMDVRWRVKGGKPLDDVEFVMEKELLVAHIGPNSSLTTHSRHKEDLVVAALFKHKQNGCYVHVGENDRDVLSNTQLFQSRGWRGINVAPGSKEQIQVLSLRDILAANLEGIQIDFMCVDSESSNLTVLKSNDWFCYRPSVIVVDIKAGGNEIIAFLKHQDYILIFDNGTNGIFITKEFGHTQDENIREDLHRLENIYGLRTVLPCNSHKDDLQINYVYGHQSANIIRSFKRGNVSIIFSQLPIEGCDHYAYSNSFSYRGRQSGLNILIMLEPAVVLPGEYDERVWQHFDHILALFDTLMDRGGKFHKILFPRADISGVNPVTEIQSRRESLYPLSGRKNAVCMISGNKSSHVPGELYSKRIEAAQWFFQNAKMPFDVFGKPPFQLPNYRGVIPDGEKLAVLKQYRFSLCFENTNDPELSAGYVTEKMLDCLETRTIPIYLGASNIEKYLPASCFIDFRKFAGYADLEKYLQKMTDKDYKRYVAAIDAWVTGGHLAKFAEAPLYDALAMLCAKASEMNIEKLFAGATSWTICKPAPPTARQWQFVATPAMWTWKHLSTSNPPLLENGKIVDLRKGNQKHITEENDRRETKSILIVKKPSIKVMVAGSKFFSGNARLGYDYGWWNLCDALNRFENIEMLFFDYTTVAQQRGIAGMSERLEEIIYKAPPDILFYSPVDGLAGILPASLKSITDATNTQTFLWLNDQPVPSHEETKLWSSCTDYIITNSNESVSKYQEAGFDRKIIISQLAFNPFTYPAKTYQKNREISFVGSAKGSRSDMIDQIRQSGLSVDTFGNGWYDDSYIPFYDMVKIFGQSKINLDLCRVNAAPTGQIGRRVFEVTGCRGFLITHPSENLEEYYEPGKEVVSASSPEELIDKCRYYLTHESEREAIALRGYERTIKEHTWAHRLRDIFQQIGFAAISKPMPAPGRSPLITESAPGNKAAPPIDVDDDILETTINVMAYNQLEYTKKCVESILHYTKGSYELLLTDNGSTDGTIEYFTSIRNFHPHTRVVRNFQNRIAESAVNHSTSMARGKYYVFVSNDTLVHEDWLENLIRHIESAPEIGWVGPRSNSISGPQLEAAGYDTLETFQSFAAERSHLHRGENFPVERLAGMLVITKKQYFERIGGADIFLPANGRDGGYGFSDDDISLRFRLAGYKLIVANDVYIHHYGSVSARQDRPDLFGAPQNINKEKYIKKIKNNSRITIGTDGKMILNSYSLDDTIPVEEQTVIRTPQICFVETGDDFPKTPDAESRYAAVARKFNGQLVLNQGKTIQSLILKILDEKQYDFLVLIDSRLAPSQEIISALTQSALCHPDVAVMVPVGNYASSTHRHKTDFAQQVEIIPYADLSLCAIHLKILRPLRAGLAQCENDNELLRFMQRRVRGEGCFIAKTNDIEVNSSVPILAHPYDAQMLPEQLIKEKKYTEAIAIYQDDLRRDPKFAEAYYQLACIARAQRRTEEAIKQAEQALRADPHHIESLIFLSGLLMAQNDWKRAESFVSQASFKQPGNPDVQKIVEQYENAKKQNPDLLKTEEGRKIPVLKNAEFVKGRTSIVIAASSNHSHECLTAIKKQTQEPYELIVVDGLTTPDLKKKLRKSVKEHSPYKILEHNSKESLLHSINQGINCSTGEYIIILADDVVVSKGWLSGMLTCMHRVQNAGIIGPMANSATGSQHVMNESYQSVNHLDKYAAEFKERFHDRRVRSRNLAGFCMLFKRSLAEKIGLFDERFAAGNFEDEDFCWRSALAGYQNYIAGDVFIHSHKGKESQGDRKIIDKKWTLSMDSPEGKKLAVLKASELAEILYSRGEIDRAAEALINCITFTPDAKEIYYELSRIFIESKRFPEAWEVIGTMPEGAKNDLKGLEYAGYAKEGLGLDDEATVSADKILSLNENHPAALNLKGILAFKKDEKDIAQNYFRKAITADPGFGESYVNLGVLYWGMGQEDEALALLREGFMLSPAVPDNSTIYYSALSSLGTFSDAEADFREACRLCPHRKNLAFLYIDILIQQGKFDVAMLRIEDALALFGMDEGILNAALAVREKIGPLRIDKSSNRATLSFCMIVKNEENYLVKCLRSVRDVADEIIIVDTGSTDKTIDIAKVFGARLFDFPWTGDFSAARNRSLEEATGDWIFLLDADEVISTFDFDELKKITGHHPSTAAAYAIETRNYLNNETVIGWTPYDGKYPDQTRLGWMPGGKVRLFTRNKDVYFTHPVHELLEPSLIKAKIPIYPSKVVVHHYGKLDEVRDWQKGEDYYLLGKMKHENDPTNVKYILELAKQAQLLQKNEEAMELWLKLLSFIEDDHQSSAYQEIARITYGDPISEIYTMLTASYMALNRFGEALSSARKSMEMTVKKRKEYVNVYAQIEIIAGSLEKAFSALEEQLKIMPDYSPALTLTAVIFYLEGKKEEAQKIFQVLRAKQFEATSLLNRIARRLHTNKKKDEALIIIHAVIENKISNAETQKMLEELQKG